MPAKLIFEYHPDAKGRELLIASFPMLKTKAGIQSFAFETDFIDQSLAVQIETLQQQLVHEIDQGNTHPMAIAQIQIQSKLLEVLRAAHELDFTYQGLNFVMGETTIKDVQNIVSSKTILEMRDRIMACILIKLHEKTQGKFCALIGLAHSSGIQRCLIEMLGLEKAKEKFEFFVTTGAAVMLNHPVVRKYNAIDSTWPAGMTHLSSQPKDAIQQLISHDEKQEAVDPPFKKHANESDIKNYALLLFNKALNRLHIKSSQLEKTDIEKAILTLTAALSISNPPLLPFDASTENKILETIEESLIKKPKNLVAFFCCRDFYSVNLSTLSLVLLTMSGYPLKSPPSASLRSQK